MELLQQTVKKNLLAKPKVGITQKFLGALISDVSTQKKELKSHKKGTQNTSKGSSFVLNCVRRGEQVRQ